MLTATAYAATAPAATIGTDWMSTTLGVALALAALGWMVAAPAGWWPGRHDPSGTRFVPVTPIPTPHPSSVLGRSGAASVPRVRQAMPRPRHGDSRRGLLAWEALLTRRLLAGRLDPAVYRAGMGDLARRNDLVTGDQP